MASTPGDAKCSKCGTSNWGSRRACRWCHAALPRPLGSVIGKETRVAKGSNKVSQRNNAWVKPPANQGLATGSAQGKDQTNKAEAAGGDAAEDAASASQKRSEKITLFQESIDKLVAAGLDAKSPSIVALTADANDLRSQRNDSKDPNDVVRDIQKRISAKEKQRDGKTATIEQQEEQLEALRQAIVDNKAALEKIGADLAALAGEKEAADAKATSAKIATTKLAHAPLAVTELLAAVGGSIDIGHPETATKFQDLCAQIKAATTQLATLRPKPPARARSASRRRATKQEGEQRQQPPEGDAPMGDGEDTTVRDATRKEAEKRAAEAGIDQATITAVLAHLNEAEDEAKRRRCA